MARHFYIYSAFADVCKELQISVFNVRYLPLFVNSDKMYSTINLIKTFFCWHQSYFHNKNKNYYLSFYKNEYKNFWVEEKWKLNENKNLKHK